MSGPLDYILSTPGKNTRNLLIDAFNAWLEVPEPLLEVIKNVITILHTASLLYVNDSLPIKSPFEF